MPQPFGDSHLGSLASCHVLSLSEWTKMVVMIISRLSLMYRTQMTCTTV